MKRARIDTNNPRMGTVPFQRNVHDAIDQFGVAGAESREVRCPRCGRLLTEYLYGVARFKCPRCKWQGIIAADEHWQITINPAPEGAPERSAAMATPTPP